MARKLTHAASSYSHTLNRVGKLSVKSHATVTPTLKDDRETERIQILGVNNLAAAIVLAGSIRNKPLFLGRRTLQAGEESGDTRRDNVRLCPSAKVWRKLRQTLCDTLLDTCDNVGKCMPRMVR
jgi:hypothetical protein